MSKLPISTNQPEKYPGRLPDILQQRASVVSSGIRRINEAVPVNDKPVVDETQVINSGMTFDQKRQKILDTKSFVIDTPTMPQDVYIAALASETSSEKDKSTAPDPTNADLFDSAQAALRDIFAPRSEN